MAQVNIPDDLYQRLKQRAEEHHRSVEAQLLKTLSAGLVVEEAGLPPDFAAALVALEETDDEALLRAAANPPSLKMEEALQQLRARQKRTDLSPAEKRKLDELLYQYDLAAMLRTRAAVLLKQRGHHIDG